jgi:hypothetical protein
VLAAATQLVRASEAAALRNPDRAVAKSPARHSECAQKARTVGINQSLTDR